VIRVAAGTVLAVAAVILGASCGSSRAQRPATTTTTSPKVALVSSVARQVALARSSSSVFSIFPAEPGAKACRIPEGGLSPRLLGGVCVTSIRYGHTHEPDVIVSFTEKWPYTPCPRGVFCADSAWKHHTWRVSETGPSIAVTDETGSIAPQYYY
jgi:hypothetical protein